MPPVFNESNVSNGPQNIIHNSMYTGRSSEPAQFRSRVSETNNISLIPEPIEEEPGA